MKTHPKSYDEFVAKYPTIFKIPLNFGLECGAGWYDLIDRLCHNIVSIENFNQIPEESRVAVTQIKEKFGTLSFYHIGGDNYLEGMVTMTEAFSASVCEECGEKGDWGRQGHWYMTRCVKCAPENFVRIEDEVVHG